MGEMGEMGEMGGDWTPPDYNPNEELETKL